MAQDGLHAIKQVDSGGPKPQRLPDGTYVTACYWGITKQQVSDYFDECRQDPQWSDEDRVKVFVQKFVKPKTDGTGMGVALLLNQDDPKQINILVSHAWQENVKRFFEDALENLCDHEVAFICFLSNYQDSPEEIDAQLGHDIVQSPFTQILKSYACQRLLVVPNEELRKNGSGLYSRLWCDWEITVAAGQGLPIHITARNSMDYLLGESVSSRQARCGNPKLPINHDEKMIREAIEQRHPENGKYQAIRLLTLVVCIAYGPRVCVAMTGRRSRSWWRLGYLLGFIVGVILVFSASRPARSLWHWRLQHDGYKKLDSIIRQAAMHRYEHRRFRPRYDYPVMGLSCFLCCVANVLYPFFNTDQHQRHQDFAGRCLDGATIGFMLWPVLNVNTLGPWTGVFILRPFSQRWWCLAILCGMLIGANLGSKALHTSGGEQGALWGLLVGIAVLSAVHEKWYHVAAIGFDLIFMIGVYFLMLQKGCWLLWRDCFFALLGVSSLSLAPGWSRKQKLLNLLVGLMVLGGLLAIDGLDVMQDDSLEDAMTHV